MEAKFKNQEQWIFNCFVKPIEISIPREFSSRLYYPCITQSYVLGHVLSNALSVMAIQHVERDESTFKVAQKNAKSRKSTFWPNRIEEILQNS